MSPGRLLAGILLPESVISTGWFSVLSAFVAVNTVLYLTLAVMKVFPKAYLSDFVDHRDRRRETRSIYPEGFDPETDGTGWPRPDETWTKARIYTLARELDLAGRSKLNKADLLTAVIDLQDRTEDRVPVGGR